MFPRAVIDPSIPKENAWIVKARLALQGEKAIEPFNFIPAVRSSFRLRTLSDHYSDLVIPIVLRQAQQHRDWSD